MNMNRFNMKKFNNYQEFLNEGIDPLKHLTQKQVDWCNKHIKGEWGVNSKGEVTVRKDLEFKDWSFDRFPVQFANVKGNFDCRECHKLVSLEGAPREVGGFFSCSHCKNLTSLKGAPREVGGYFKCEGCDNLTSLEGAPQSVEGVFDCDNCPNLTSLEGAPREVGGYFSCSYCDSLASLEGAPQRVHGSFDCWGCEELPEWESDLIDEYNKGHKTWEEVWKILHKETYRKAAQTGLI
jgi:hypothetical protein